MCLKRTMGINYRAEPMRERLRKKEDPAYLFSSFVHGDPAMPILETYPGDELMRLSLLFRRNRRRMAWAVGNYPGA